jgi:hypothetical protein
MTNGQIRKLQELSKCYLVGFDRSWLVFLQSVGEYKMDSWDKPILRRLWHQYRHQIKAMKRNRQIAERQKGF